MPRKVELLADRAALSGNQHPESRHRAGPTALVRRGGSEHMQGWQLQSDRACMWESTRNLTLRKAGRHGISKRKIIYRDTTGRAAKRGQQSLISAPAEPRPGARVFLPPQPSGTNSYCTSVLREEARGPRTISSSAIHDMIPTHPGAEPRGPSTPPGHTSHTT